MIIGIATGLVSHAYANVLKYQITNLTHKEFVLQPVTNFKCADINGLNNSRVDEKLPAGKNITVVISYASRYFDCHSIGDSSRKVYGSFTYASWYNQDWCNIQFSGTGSSSNTDLETDSITSSQHIMCDAKIDNNGTTTIEIKTKS